MKRISLARRNSFLTPSGVSWGVSALGFVLLLLCVRLIFPNFFWKISAPVVGVGSSVTRAVTAFSSSFTSKATLEHENELLTAQNEALSIENRTLAEKALDAEKLLGGAPKTLSGGVVAGVVLRPPESPYDTLVVAAGSNDNVAEGDYAFGAGGTPLGTVTSVTGDYARITLFSAPSNTTSGWIGSARVPLTLTGTGGGTFSATVSRGAGVVVGDVVSLAGPGAVPVGSVVRIDGDPASPTLTLRIVPATNLFSLSSVRIERRGL